MRPSRRVATESRSLRYESRPSSTSMRRRSSESGSPEVEPSISSGAPGRFDRPAASTRRSIVGRRSTTRSTTTERRSNGRRRIRRRIASAPARDDARPVGSATATCPISKVGGKRPTSAVSIVTSRSRKAESRGCTKAASRSGSSARAARITATTPKTATTPAAIAARRAHGPFLQSVALIDVPSHHWLCVTSSVTPVTAPPLGTDTRTGRVASPSGTSTDTM